jgi:integrase
VIEIMPKRLLPHLNRIVTRHGKALWYFRINKGPRTPLPFEYGSAEFMAAYDAALSKHLAAPKKPDSHTIAWLIDQYQASPQWATTAKETKKQFKYQFTKMKERGGQYRISDVDETTVNEGRDERAHKPSDANKFVKATRKLFAFAKERGFVKSNPAAETSLIKLTNRAFGFHAWTEDEVCAFEAHWPIGTRERLALDLLLYTGVRRSDVVRLGRQHVRNGAIIIKTEKSVNMGKPVAIEVMMLPPLTRSIMATKTGDMTFLVTAKGTPFVKESFGTWFKRACVQAGVQGSSHGLRKIAAVRCAENGATEAMLNAMFGWADGSKESATYVRSASRSKLSRANSQMLIPTGLGQFTPTQKKASKNND